MTTKDMTTTIMIMRMGTIITHDHDDQHMASTIITTMIMPTRRLRLSQPSAPSRGRRRAVPNRRRLPPTPTLTIDASR